jgi:hypothetical protein
MKFFVFFQVSSDATGDNLDEQGSTQEKISKKYVILFSRCFLFIRKKIIIMLARLTRNIFSAGRFQNVLNLPFKWYAF